MPTRTWLDYDHAHTAGYEGYFEGLTLADVPHDEYSGRLREQWLWGWREAMADDQRTVERFDQ